MAADFYSRNLRTACLNCARGCNEWDATGDQLACICARMCRRMTADILVQLILYSDLSTQKNAVASILLVLVLLRSLHYIKSIHGRFVLCWIQVRASLSVDGDSYGPVAVVFGQPCTREVLQFCGFLANPVCCRLEQGYIVTVKLERSRNGRSTCIYGEISAQE